MQGYIKLHRKLLDWEWYTNIPVRILFEHCLLRANHKSKKWNGQEISVGSFITSYEKLSIETGLTIQQVRTAINKLKLTGEITYKSTSHYSIISINNWDEYQVDNIQNNKQITNKQQTNNKQITTNKNDKNEKNDKNKEEVEEEKPQLQQPQKFYGEFQNVHLTDENYNKLLGICCSKQLLEQLIDQLSAKIGTGDESPYNVKCPDAHYIRLRSYYKQRKMYPHRYTTNVEEIDGWNL